MLKSSANATAVIGTTGIPTRSCGAFIPIELTILRQRRLDRQAEALRNWLAARSGREEQLHFTPTSASWLNLMSRELVQISKLAEEATFAERCRKAVVAIKDYLRHHQRRTRSRSCGAPCRTILDPRSVKSCGSGATPATDGTGG